MRHEDLIQTAYGEVRAAALAELRSGFDTRRILRARG